MSSFEDSNLDSLDAQLKTKLAERDELISRIRGLKLKRREIMPQVQQLSSSISQTRGERAPHLKKLRSVNEERRSIIDELKVLRGRLKDAKEVWMRRAQQVQGRSKSSLTDELDSLEWKLQTSPLSKGGEKAIVERIRQLEFDLQLSRSVEEAEMEFTTLRERVTNLESRLMDLDREKAESSLLLNQTGWRMKSDVESRREAIEELKLLIEEINRLVEALHKVDKDYSNLIEEKRRLMEEGRRLSAQHELVKGRTLLQYVKENAKARLARKEKLTFNELKLALSEDTQDLEV